MTTRSSGKFLVASFVWGLIGMLVGLLIALQLASPAFNLGLSFTSFGRLRPLHTNAVIFAFAGNAFFCGCYYSTQRLLKARMFSDTLSNIHFWGWQLIILSAALTLPFGYTQAKEYAELEWPIDIAIAVVWVIFAINFIGTMVKRRERHLYVAIWFYVASIITVAILHIFNNLSIPAGPLKSYSIYAGVQDAFMQWWYGHNAVAFFLTTPFLGLMYYFMPKAAEGPVFSYRLSILHFWSLVFLYIWAGPHHLHYTALRVGLHRWHVVLRHALGAELGRHDQRIAHVTRRVAQGRRRPDPQVLRRGHHRVRHVHVRGPDALDQECERAGALHRLDHRTRSYRCAWLERLHHVRHDLLAVAAVVPGNRCTARSWRNTTSGSGRSASCSMWYRSTSAGLTQGLMWRAFDETGRLAYPDFVETVAKLVPMYWMRAVGGLLYIVGMFMFGWNILMTWRARPRHVRHSRRACRRTVAEVRETGGRSAGRRRTARAVQTRSSSIATGSGCRSRSRCSCSLPSPSHRCSRSSPRSLIKSNVPTIASVKPYSPLELHGRDIYIREGCFNCHSQMVRPFRYETERYGEYSKPGESVYDHPFLWGSRRIGPDLAREGRQVPKPLARAPFREPARDRGEVDHAVIRTLRDEHHRLVGDRETCGRDGHAGCSVWWHHQPRGIDGPPAGKDDR